MDPAQWGAKQISNRNLVEMSLNNMSLSSAVEEFSKLSAKHRSQIMNKGSNFQPPLAFLWELKTLKVQGHAKTGRN